MRSKKYAEGGDIAKGAVSGMSMGASLGSAIPGVGTLIGAGAGAIIGGVSAALQKDPVAQYKAMPASNTHMFAMGGNIQDKASVIEAGGTHEQNPNGGVPVTNQALLEEGEVKVGNKVFSKRLINPETGKSFADEAKSYLDPKRPNDVIINRYATKKLNELFVLQESMKAPEQTAQEPGQPQMMAYGGKMMYDGGIVPPTIPPGAVSGDLNNLFGYDNSFLMRDLDGVGNIQNRPLPTFRPEAAQVKGTRSPAPITEMSREGRLLEDVNSFLPPPGVESATPLGTLPTVGNVGALPATISTGQGTLPVKDLGNGTNFAEDLTDAKNYLNSIPGESLPDLYNTPMKYAALASNVAQLGLGLMSRERNLGSEEFTNNQFLEYKPVSYDQAFRNLSSSYGAYKSAAAGASGGSAARLLNSLQGLNLGQSKAVADLAFQADRENEARRMAVAQTNSQINAQNQAVRMQTEMANQANSAAYTSAINQGIGSIGNTLGNMRTEDVRLGIANRMTGYNASGEYKMIDQFNKLKSQNSNYTWEQYLADVQSGKITVG